MNCVGVGNIVNPWKCVPQNNKEENINGRKKSS